ncbi:EFCB3 protein, partial [Nyctiprogne leucopyga]|nr:EFCB3 protein [Nyctiprogne leucopyga]
AFSEAFNLLPKDPDGNVKLRSLEVTAKELGISVTSQGAYDELVFADAVGDRTVEFSDFLDIVTDKKYFAQTIYPDSGSFDSVDARGILVFKVFWKLVESVALPRRTRFRIISYYQQKLRECIGQKVGKDGEYCRKKHHKIRKELVYPTPAFVSAAHVSAMNKREAATYMEHLKVSDSGSYFSLPRSGSPHPHGVPISPLISKQDAMTQAKPTRGLQRNEPPASFESHFIHERNQVQEEAALKLPAHYRKQRHSPTTNAKRLNTPQHLTARLGKTQVQKARAAKRCGQSPALQQRRNLLRLWRKMHEGQTGLQRGNESFRHTFCIYTWSWDARRELVTVADLCRLDHQLCRKQRARQR